jgi:diaminopimelate decarboxylase
VDLKFYKKDDIETDIEELGKKLTKRFKAFCTEKDLTLIFEPGKFQLKQGLLAKVNVVKQTTSTVLQE